MNKKTTQEMLAECARNMRMTSKRIDYHRRMFAMYERLFPWQVVLSLVLFGVPFFINENLKTYHYRYWESHGFLSLLLLAASLFGVYLGFKIPVLFYFGFKRNRGLMDWDKI